MSLSGFRSQLGRVRRLLLLARRVPRLPRLALGLRLRLQLLARLTTLWRCGGCHVSSFSAICQAREGVRSVYSVVVPDDAVQ